MVFNTTEKTQQRQKIIFVVVGFLFALLAPVVVSAEEINRSYFYENITTNITINKDTTFNVEERQLYSYEGTYHKGWRSIPLKGVDAITDIRVIDGKTGRAFVKSSTKQDKTNPASWGKYTTYRENGNQVIEWYYHAHNEKHLWILEYKVHGGLSFFQDHDELYWNIFTNYEVPINIAEAHVALPDQVHSSLLKASLYVDPRPVDTADAAWSLLPDGSFSFVYKNVPPQADMTIAPGWPKGIVDQDAYWIDFIKTRWGYFLAFLLIIGSVVYAIGYWVLTEKFNQGRGTIIPQYEPPQNLPPLMAEIIIREAITAKAWPATIIDLAVRGYVKIYEEGPNIAGSLFSIVGLIWFLFIPIVFIIETYWAVRFIAIFGLSLFAWRNGGFVALRNLGTLFTSRHYRIEKLKPLENDEHLKTYEKKFLDLIFAYKSYFSTREMSKNPEYSQNVALGISSLKNDIYNETEVVTGAYASGFRNERKRKTIISIVFVVILFSFFVGFDFFSLLLTNNSGIFTISIILAGAIVLFCRSEARLNKEGQILKEDWLGFKLFLETAEKYRMQNLTPDMFEKYLPYAIIFGVEKKWAHAFESFNMPAPSWYAGGLHGATASDISSGTGFSISSFSSSFSASFTSSFSSSGGGGASGGGGGAGGGGGGGGGGAS